MRKTQGSTGNFNSDTSGTTALAGEFGRASVQARREGLVWHYWGAILTPQDCAASIVVRSDGLGFLGYLLTKLRPRDRVVGNLGNGALLYQGIQATDCPQLTMWVFSIYGGLWFGESSHDPNGKHSIIFAITGPRTLLPNFWASVFKEELPAA